MIRWKRVVLQKAERFDNLGFREDAEDLRALLPPPRRPSPSRVERKAKKVAKGEARRATRPLCEERAGGCCEVAIYARTRCEGALTWDHYWGRGKVPPNHEAEWMICRGHHDEKGAGDPSRLAWHQIFREHALRHGYHEQIDACDRAIALERAQHPEAA